MGRLCVLDPDKMSKVCSTGNQITISLSNKGQKHFQKAQKIYEKKNDMTPIEREKFSQIMKSSIPSNIKIESNDVKSAVCINSDGYDSLVILHSNNSMINKQFNSPILPILVKSGKCQKIVDHSFLKGKIEPKEVFIGTAKNEIADLRQYL